MGTILGTGREGGGSLDEELAARLAELLPPAITEAETAKADADDRHLDALWAKIPGGGRLAT